MNNFEFNNFNTFQMPFLVKVKEAKIRNRYNHVPHLTRDIIWESDKTHRNITHKTAKMPKFLLNFSY